MANLIKNQVMKHLAKFFKNLSTDSFKLSTMKGFCELNNLELNEEVLMDLLELPVWLNISRATCSRAAIKIPWATLNKQPICLGLEEVNVQVEICENFRDLKNSVSLNQGSTSKYGWIDRVIDGIRITISSVVINFALSALSATFQIAQLEVESRPPNWKPCNDLRTTNFRDKDRGLVLNFKHIEWQTMKFEAKTESSAFSAPLRLICQGSCRLMMKKRLSDCQVVGARIMLVFNDLLWVLTDAMLVSAFHFVTYIFDLIKRAPINKKILEEPAPPKNISKLKMMVDNNAVKKYLEASKLFNFETSYHLVINCLQLQICDDLDPVHGRSSFASLSGGGALHVVIDKFVLDIYPYEKALGSRDNWLKYGDPSTTRDTWIRHHLFEFAERLANLPQNDLPSSRERKSAHQSLSDLYSMVILLRLGNYCVKTVSTSGSRRGGRKFGADTDERKFLTTGNFPGDLPALYVEFNQYYYYEYGSTRVSLSRPVPDPVIFANAVPLRLIVDLPTILWLNALQSNLEKSIADLKKILPQSESDTNMLVRIEALMPTISIDLKKPGNSSSNPIGAESGPFNQNAYGSMQLNCSKVVITNSVREASYLSRLNESLQKMGSCNFFTKRESFPWIDQIDSRPLANGFLKIMDSQNLNYHNQVWVIDCEPVWFDFIEKGSSRTVPIIDPIHATIWAYFSDSLLYDKQPESKESTVDCDVNMVLCIPEPVKISIEHDGYIFILRLMEKLEEFGSFISEDSLKIANFHGNEPMKSPRASIISLIPGIEIEVLLDRKEVHSDNSSMKTQYKPRTPNLPRDYINGSSSVDRVSSEQSLPQTSPSKSELSFRDPLMDPLRDNPSDSQPTPNFDYKSSSKESSGLTPSESSLTFSDLIPDLSPNDEDDRSIRSDLSADDELVIIGFGNLELEDDVYFTGNSIGVEKALEATELCVNESGDNPSNLTQVRSKPEILSLSYLTLKIGSLAFVKQSNGFHSSLLAKLSEIFINEFNNIPFNEYNDAKIGRNSKISNNDSLNVKNSSPENKNSSSIIMRFDSVLNPSLKSELMSIKIEDIEVSIDKDILLKLMDFLDDPFAEKVKPAIYHLQNVFFKIVDNNLKAPPLGMKFRDTLAEQTEDNIIRIIPSALNGSEHMLICHSDSVRAGLGSSVDEKAKQMKKLESDTNELLSIIAAENSRLLSQIAELQLENERLRKNQSVTQED